MSDSRPGWDAALAAAQDAIGEGRSEADDISIYAVVNACYGPLVEALTTQLREREAPTVVAPQLDNYVTGYSHAVNDMVAHLRRVAAGLATPKETPNV